MAPQVPLVGAVWANLENLAREAQSVTPGYRERLDPEGFPVCLACLDLTEHLVLRETAESKETEARPELEWKVQWVLRDLMDCLDLQVLESQASRGSEDPLESKDCEVWLEARDLWVPRVTASFARLYKCRLTEDQARKDKLGLYTDFENWKTELITARVVTLDINVWRWMFNSIVIIEQFVTNIYNVDKRVNLYFIRQSIYN